MRIWQSIKPYILGLFILAIAFLAVRYSTAKYHRAGTETVLQAQAMDSTQMGAPMGTVPVAVETAKAGMFTPTVTYTGSIVALNDEDVLPRVTGTLVSLNVYPGDHVRAGQVIARLDSIELKSRSNEATYAKLAALNAVGISNDENVQSRAQQRSAEGKVRSLLGMLRDSESQLTASLAMQDESERDADAASAGLNDAEANVTAMKADLDYWNIEISREDKLYTARAVSLEEYQRELSQAKSAQAKLTQAQAGVQAKSSMVAGVKAKIRQSAATVIGARAKIDQVNADIMSAQADLNASAAGVSAASKRIRQRGAMARMASAQERTADIMRDYTEIRAGQDGVVTERLVSPGTLVQPGTVIVRIKNTDRVRLQANVAEEDIANIRTGYPVIATTQGDQNSRLQTRITSIFNAANLQSRTIVVEALAANPGHRLIPGQYMVMQIATATPRLVVTVPQSAILRDVDLRPYVWTAISGRSGRTPTAHRVEVVLDAAGGQRAIVKTGVRPGDQVIYEGYENLIEGDALTLTEWSSEGPRTLPEGPGRIAPMPGMDMGNGGRAPAPKQKMDGGLMKQPEPAAPKSGSATMKDMPGM